MIVISFGLLCFATNAIAQSAFDDPGARVAGGQGGDLKPVKDKIDAGSVTVNSSSQTVVLFRNDDIKPVATGAINLYASSNINATISENQCAAAAIAPGEVCAISVQIKGLQQGKYRIEMLMRHDGHTKLVTASVEGNVESTGSATNDLVSDVEAIPAIIDFGTLDKSSSQAQVKSVVLRNITSKAIKIEDVKIEASGQSGLTQTSNCTELQSGAACIVAINWSPQQKGPASGTLVVKHDGPTGITSVDLKGIYNPDAATVAKVFPEAVPGKGLLVASRETVDFGTGVSQSSSITVSLVNSGDVPLTLTDIHMTNAEDGVHTEHTGCHRGSVLAPLEACPLTLTWDPVREGAIVDDVQIAHTGARGVLVLPLRGNAAKAINKDTKAIMIGDHGDAILNNIQPLSLKDIEENGEEVSEDGSRATVNKDDNTPVKKTTKNKKSQAGYQTDMSAASEKSSSHSTREQDIRGVLDGYAITSYSPKRAIVSGPGGSRVIFNGEQTVIGGVLWQVFMRPSAVEFQNGSQKVLLLFDKSLSSINSVTTQSGNSGTSSSASSSAGSSPASTSGSTTTP